MQVRAYVHDSIRREGLRDKLHLNPMLFHDDAEILNDLELFLPGWRTLAERPPKEALSLKANVRYHRVATPGGGEDERYMLMVGVENDGEQDATDFRLDVEFPANFVDESGHIARKNTSKPGIALFQVYNKDRHIEHLYPGDQIPDVLTFHYAIRGKVKRENPELLNEKVTATVFSGNMKPKVTFKTIAQLMN